ncbi:MAG: DUF2085 domain-containing protein [Anaerolineales bacterium]|jgi:uncharacterized membrane protein
MPRDHKPATPKDEEQKASAPSMVKRAALFLLAGLVIGFWIALTPPGLLGKADAVGYAVCHQIPVRTFQLGDRSLPLCARCSGVYLAFLLTVVYFMARGRGKAGGLPSRPIMILLIVFGLAFTIDGLNSYFSLFPSMPHLYEPSNTLRLAAGMLLGIALGALVYPVFNQAVWREWRGVRALQSLGDLVVLVLLAALLVIILLSGNPLILYPLAILSSASVLAMLAAVYAVVVLIVLRRENRADSWRDLFFPLLAGLTLGLIQIGLISLLRYALTGSWGGFVL